MNHLLNAFDNQASAITQQRPAVWMMRQAGRYMPEYQAVRGKVSFLELCKTPDLAVEVSLQPWRAFDMDAVIMFSDILIPVEAMGVPVAFIESKGPVLPEPLRHTDELKSLLKPDPIQATGFVMEILKRLRRELKDSPDTALIGFAGAPWTLAAYMVEGGTSRNHIHLKQWMYEAPDSLHQLLQHTTDVVMDYLNAQAAAGAQALQLFDTWAGILNKAQYQEFVLPYHQQIFSRVTAVPTMLYVQNSPHLLELMAISGADGLSIDWHTDLSEARARVGPGLVLQGNLDPVALFANIDALTPLVAETLTAGSGEGNHRYIFNLGHGILPQTPVPHVAHVVNQVKSWKPSRYQVQ